MWVFSNSPVQANAGFIPSVVPPRVAQVRAGVALTWGEQHTNNTQLFASRSLDLYRANFTPTRGWPIQWLKRGSALLAKTLASGPADS